MRRLAYFCCGFAVATALAVAMTIPVQYAIIFMAATATCLMLCRFVSNRMFQRVAILLLGLSLGILYTENYQQWREIPVHHYAGDTHRIQGMVTQWPVETGYGYSVEVSLQMEGYGNVPTILYVDEEGKNLQPGDQIATIARLHDASVMETGERTTYYTAQGIFLTGSAYGEVSVTRPESVPLRLQPLYWVKTLQAGIQTAFSEDSAPFIATLVTGDSTHLDDQIITALRRTGMAHTVAVSGMHLGVLAGALTLLLGINRRRTALVVIPVCFLFAVMVGAHPSIVRAAIMITMILLAPLCNRQADGFTSLFFALVLILLPNPYAIAHVGLQLSFGSILGLFCFATQIFGWVKEKIPKKFGRKGTLPCRIIGGILVAVASVISATLGVMITTTPIIAYYFRSVSLIAPVVNLLALWTVVWCFGGGLVAGGLAVVAPQLGWMVAQLIEPLVDYYYWVNLNLGNIPFAALPTDSEIAVGWLIFVYAVVAFWLWRREYIYPLVPITAIVVGLTITIAATIYESNLGVISTTVLDVGQGQSVLFRMGETTALVDCGGSDSVLVGDLAADTLLQGGDTKLDYLVLTHCHADHCNGVLQLMERIDVSELVLPATEGEDQGLREEILAAAEEREIPVTLVRDDTIFPTELGTIKFIPPLGNMKENERGLTVLASYGDFDVLITGDMGEETEQRLVEHYDLPQVELYVAGHHGSKYASSQELLDEINPQRTVISVGENSFGHPAEEMLERLKEIGATLYRTDLQGDIIVPVGE